MAYSVSSPASRSKSGSLFAAIGDDDLVHILASLDAAVLADGGNDLIDWRLDRNNGGSAVLDGIWEQYFSVHGNPMARERADIPTSPIVRQPAAVEFQYVADALHTTPRYKPHYAEEHPQQRPGQGLEH